MSFKVLKVKVKTNVIIGHRVGDETETVYLNDHCVIYRTLAGIDHAHIDNFEVLECLYPKPQVVKTPTIPQGETLTAGQLLERHLDFMTKLLHEKVIK